jgi:predicted hydrocarbon binding protein
MEGQRKYDFRWELLGDIAVGRPNLGMYTRLELYRLMQFSFRDVIEARYGTQAADEIFYQAGKLAGTEFYRHYLSEITEFNQLISQLQSLFSEMSIGILRVEHADLEEGRFVITISEDLDCSGLPELEYELCTYDEGLIAALLESFTGKAFTVKEVDCWCTGDRTCRFQAELAA